MHSRPYNQARERPCNGRGADADNSLGKQAGRQARIDEPGGSLHRGGAGRPPQVRRRSAGCDGLGLEASPERAVGGALGGEPRGPPGAWLAAHALLGRAHGALQDAAGAEAQYQLVLDTWRGPRDAEGRLGEPPGSPAGRARLGLALNAVGEAHHFFAEKKRKVAEAIVFPTYSGPRDRGSVLPFVKTEVAAWLKKKRLAIEEAEAAYLAVLKLEPAPPPLWVVTGERRVGDLWSKFVEDFRRTPMPAEFEQDQDRRTEYLDALIEATEPQQRRAHAAYATCLDYAEKHGVRGQHPQACEQGLEATASARRTPP